MYLAMFSICDPNKQPLIYFFFYTETFVWCCGALLSLTSVNKPGLPTETSYFGNPQL